MEKQTPVMDVTIPEDAYDSVVDKMKRNVMLACEINSPYFADIESVKNGGKVIVESCSLDLEPPSMNLKMVANYTSIHEQEGTITFLIAKDQPIMGIKFADEGMAPEKDVMAVDIISKIMGNNALVDASPKMRMGLNNDWNIQQPPKTLRDEMFEQRDMLKKIMNNRGSSPPKKKIKVF